MLPHNKVQKPKNFSSEFAYRDIIPQKFQKVTLIPKIYLTFYLFSCRNFSQFYCINYANCAIMFILQRKEGNIMVLLVGIIAVAIIAAIVTACVTSVIGGIAGSELEEEE